MRILFTSTDEVLAKNTTKVYYDMVKELNQKYKEQFIYLGVMKSPVGKIQNKYRFQILIRLKKPKSDSIISEIYKMVDDNSTNGVSIFVEINPSSLS